MIQSPTNLFTFEEIELMKVFDHTDKRLLVAHIHSTMKKLDPEMLSTATSALFKLESLTDEEFTRIEFDTPISGASEADIA